MAVADEAVPVLRNFAFHEELVRVVPLERRPWFVAADVCRALQIKNVTRAVDRLPAGARTLHTVKGERPLNIISEGGLYRLVFTSRTPQAEEFVAWVADEVLPAIRENGFYGAAKPVPGLPSLDQAARGEVPESFLAKLYCIRECRLVHGVARAQLMWRSLGLPPVPPPPLTSQDEARQCLRHMLDAPAFGEGPAIRDCLEEALDENEEARALLLAAGIRVYPDRDGFVVANQAPYLRDVFHGTEWAAGYARVLRRLPGTTATGTSRFQGINRRGTFVPATLLDEQT